MNKNNKLIPSLRFPEFQNDGEWVEKKLGEVGEFRGSGVDKKIKPKEELVMLLNYMDVYRKNFIFKNDLKQQTSATNEKIEKCNIKKGDIFFTPTSETPDDIAQSAVAVEDIPNGVYSYHLIRLRLKENWDLKFRTYIFKTNSFFKKVSKLAQGSGTRYVITMPVFNSLKIPIPSLPEQQKIADFLSNLDELIAAHKQKLELLKQHKKGLMQKLFPQEGKKLPEWRFPEFKDSGEWVEKVLSKVANYENGKAHEKNIDENGEYIVVNSKYISSDGETVKYSNKAFCLAEQGDILMVLSDVPNGKAIAKCFYVPVNNKYTVNQRICKISSYDCDNKFLIYILNRNKYFLAFDDGVKQTNLKKDDVLNAPLLFPKDIKEQQKITSFLSNLDELITAQAEKIEQLERHKKGLMQRMFPEIN